MVYLAVRVSQTNATRLHVFAFLVEPANPLHVEMAVLVVRVDRRVRMKWWRKVMSFELVEEWEDADNPYKYYSRRVNAGSFATRQEADEAAKLRKPLHDGGIIRVKEVVQQLGKATPKKRRRRVSNLRVGRRNGRR